MEIWKDIEGYEGLYKISSLGRVKSNHINKKGSGWQLVQGFLNNKGYWCICLFKNNTRKWSKKHRLVAMAFIPNPENKPEVNHKDAIKIHNQVDNLEWVTTLENSKHAYKNNLVPLKIGEDNGRAKIKESDVINIRSLANNGVHYREIAKLYPINPTTVNKIINKKLWCHV